MRSVFGGLRSACLVVSLFCLSVISTSIHAQLGDLRAELPGLNASKFVYDPGRDQVYASLTAQNEIAVIANQPHALVASIPVAPSPAGLALSNDGNFLYVASSEAASIEIIDLNSLQPVNMIPTPIPVSDIVVSNNNMLFATPAVVPNNGIIQIDLNVGTVVNEFSQGINIYQNGLLALSPDKNTLYFANTGISPGTLAKYDISNGNPGLVLENPFGSLGGNGQDLAVTVDGQFISYVTGGGNNQYDINKMYSNDFFTVGSFNTGPYPRDIEYSPFGPETFIVHESGSIDIFDANTFNQIGQITTPPLEAKELFIDASGSYLYAAFDDAIRVYSAVDTVTPITAVFFSDPAMQSCFDEQAQANGWQFAEEVTSLECAGRGITSIQGIESLTRLHALNVSSNAIQSVNLSGAPVPQLRALNIENNQLTDASFIQYFPNLTGLYLGDNPYIDIYSLGFELQNMTGLTHLGLSGLPIQDLGMLPLFDPQTGQPYPLIELDLSRTQIFNADELASWPTLQSLNISRTQITNLGYLIQLTNLRKIDISYLDELFIGDITQLLQNNPNLTHISLSGIELQDLNQLPLYNFQTGQPYNLVALQVAETGISQIDPLNAFPTLQVLDVSGNDLESIQPIMNHTLLSRLNLSGNSNIPFSDIAYLLQNNRYLTHLGLADIRIPDFNAIPLFDGSTAQPYALIELDLSNTGISDIIELGQFQDLQVLDLSDNNIFDPYPIRDLVKLRELDLSNNAIINASDLPYILDNKPALQVLGLGGIPIDSLDQIPLASIQTGQPYRLKVLRLQNTGLRNIDVLWNFNDLQELDLSGNNLVDVMSLANKVNLRKLDLSGNNAIPAQDLPYLLNNKPQLTHLGLADIPLQDVPVAPTVMVNLQQLNLSNTGLQTLDQVIGFPALRSLDVSHNNIIDISLITNLPELRELNISHNQFDDLFPLSVLTNLTSLNVSGNSQLVDMNGLFVTLSNNKKLRSLSLSGLPLLDIFNLPVFNGINGQPYRLRELDVSNTQITNINALTEFPSLRGLNISDTTISDLFPVQTLAQLRELDMSNVSAYDLAALSNHSKLTRLNISHNPAIPLPEVQNVLINNPGLTELEVAGLSLGSLDQLPINTGYAYPVSMLRVLNVSNTGLTDVNRLIEFPALRELNLSGNPLAGLSGIDTLYNLRELDISSTGLYSAYDLNNLRFLEHLNVSGNNTNTFFVNELQFVIQNNLNLRSLHMAGLGITDISMVPFPMPSPLANTNSLVELNLDNNPLALMNGLEQQGALKRLSLRNVAPAEPTMPVNLAPLTSLVEPQLIDLRDNAHFICGELDYLELFYSPEVVKRPATCLQSAKPVVTILEPVDQLTVDEGTPINFVADASDLEDGYLGNQVTWSSSIDGVIGVGSGLSTTLSTGTHLITATVVDSTNQQVSQTVSVTVNTVAPVSYCSSKGTSTWFEWVESVDFAGQSHTTGNNGGYSDNTATEFVAQRGGSYPVTMYPGFRYGSYYENWAAWIDFNGDGSFTSDERVFSGSAMTMLTGTATIPVTARPGKTRMRVVMRWGGTPSACGSYYYGETEDFTINIQ
ncbi:MAG: GEVED domain-containing protein [Thioalkalispiraceae bacterium]|jgi:Leucine-rich repeat (LRR) protein